MAVGVSFGIVIGKEIFGGVGYNILNPALTARAFLFFAYPAQISGDTVWVGTAKTAFDNNIIFGTVAENVDGVTMATPLAVAAAVEKGGDAVQAMADQGFTLLNMTVGNIPGCIGSTSVIAILLGMGFLILTGIGSWRVMVSGIIGCAAMGALFNVLPLDNAFAALPFVYHLVMGGFLFGIVFMATDPVSCAATNTGKNYLRLPDRCADGIDPRGQPGLSRRGDAGHPVHECDGPVDRPLCRAGAHQEKNCLCEGFEQCVKILGHWCSQRLSV